MTRCSPSTRISSPGRSVKPRPTRQPANARPLTRTAPQTRARQNFCANQIDAHTKITGMRHWHSWLIDRMLRRKTRSRRCGTGHRQRPTAPKNQSTHRYCLRRSSTPDEMWSCHACAPPSGLAPSELVASGLSIGRRFAVCGAANSYFHCALLA